LFYRLNVINVKLPALRERKEDVPLLANHFIKKYCAENHKEVCSIGPDALRILMEYDWPGNVRELENVIERAVVMMTGTDGITPDLFPKELLRNGAGSEPAVILPDNGISLKDRLIEYERELIVAALEKTDWNQKRAAKLLNLNPTTLNEKLKRLNISKSVVH
jgi:DNA-binding NtrC family response regulator